MTLRFQRVMAKRLTDRSAENPLKSSHTVPERVYNLSYAPTTSTLLVSMAHRHVWIYNVPALAAAVEGQPLKADQERESALKFLTRSVATMVDGKGESWRRDKLMTRV